MDRVATEINGGSAALAVERAIGELRRGRAVDIVDDAKARRVAALETMRSGVANRLLASASDETSLLVSRHRAAALGLTACAGVELAISDPVTLPELHAVAGLHSPNPPDLDLRPRGSADTDATIAIALELASRGRLMPALLSVPRDAPAPGQVLEINAQAPALADAPGRVVERVSQARVPLEVHADCQMVLYRDHSADAEHVALLIGTPSPEEPVPVRLHSSCLTGDLLGSLRCDCGEQLRSSVERIAADGGGVLLYLAQEGRGIGLANKLRAYALQDAGLDTIDADLHLGFSADERGYQAAAAMLRDLELTRIQLMTNNPDKIEALRAEGIELVDHITLSSTANPHNERYLRAKRDRAGHF